MTWNRLGGVVLLSLGAAACSGAASDAGLADSREETPPSGGLPSDGAPPGADPGTTPTPAIGPSDPGGDSAWGPEGEAPFVPAPGGGGSGQVEPGTLTAGTWDDNRNFDFFLHYRDKLHDQQLEGLLPFLASDHEAAHDALAQAGGARDTLDVALVIDTTGSMGDEMTYLQSEFIALSQAIHDGYPNAEQRWSLIVYRDVGDEYVVRDFDFETDANAFQSRLAAQLANGGGDFPEAPDAALARAAELSWRSDGSTARLIFWVADAPHHAQNAAAMAAAIGDLAELDVHTYPVASSGIDEVTELSMRSAAQLTGGRYLFLTDDSGVGGEHKEPSIPCYYVTKLDRAILRMVDIELSGEYREPDPEEILRSGGNPHSGACDLDGQSYHAY